VVAYLTDGRFKAPKDATVEIIPVETLTKSAETEAGTKSGTIPGAVPGALETRRPLPTPATPQ
jgi:gamma-glutamyltranspeptidase